MPLILYAVAVLGFTVSGIGLLGVTPFTAVVRPFLALASTYSLIAIWRMGGGDLWWGAGFDVVLFVAGITGAYRWLPEGPRHGTWAHRAGVALAAAFIVYVVAAMVMWPYHRAWGSERGEYALALPGDAPDRNPALEVQHAVTVNAPPEDVWPWLVEIARIRGWRTAELQPNRAMVVAGAGAFVLEPLADGGTRFIIRTRVGDRRYPAWGAALSMMTLELPHFIRERRMMLQIKALAEEGRAS
jgi:hypothetical protein